MQYIAFFDRVANRYCSDLIPCDDNDALLYRLAKRFSKNTYCKFVKLHEIECRRIAKWDSENSGLTPYKKPENESFTLDMVDDLYVALAKRMKVEDVQEVTIPEVKTEVNYGDFVRDVEKQQNVKETVENEQISD